MLSVRCAGVLQRSRPRVRGRLYPSPTTTSVSAAKDIPLFSSSPISVYTQCISRQLHTHTLAIESKSYSNAMVRSIDHPFSQQVRWKRKDGNRYSFETKTPNKKQLKKYNRKLRAKSEIVDRHGKPGSKAGPRREAWEAMRQSLLDSDTNEVKKELEYGTKDAMLDNFVGNTAHLTSTPTPKPLYLGDMHDEFKSRVVQQMSDFQAEVQRIESGLESTEEKQAELSTVTLPTDYDVSLALRAFRDLNGTKKNPVGIYRALNYLLQELNVPLTLLEDLSFTTLMTCAKTPSEGRRVMQLMKQQNFAVSTYSWSILVDIYAKSGDFAGAAQVQKEMMDKGTKPSLASYTSLIASCARFCRDGRNAHSLRASAGKLAWEKWQEARIVGLKPDAMVYGAILQVLAAQGQPEKAMNMLEEMQQFDVKPTTLCFTNALRAISRSHATAVRYERGSSRKNKRRETLTLHHGRLVQKVVILAENAEVEQDEGFVAALIMCAAATGDLATAKAVFVASKLRKLTDLRSIGNDDHLAQLRGEGRNAVIGENLQLESGSVEGDSNHVAVLGDGNYVPDLSLYEEMEDREYGKDARICSAMMHACAVASDPNNVGTIWQGRENDGLLCENSLRLIVARKIPEYLQRTLPPTSRGFTNYVDVEGRDESYRDGKRQGDGFIRQRAKDIETSDPTYEDLGEELYKLYVNEDGSLKEEYRKSTFMDIWKMKYGEHQSIPNEFGRSPPERIAAGTETASQGGGSKVEEVTKTVTEEMYFDKEERKWKIVGSNNENAKTDAAVAVIESSATSENDDTVTTNSTNKNEVKEKKKGQKRNKVKQVDEAQRKAETPAKPTAYEEKIMRENAEKSYEDEVKNLEKDFEEFYTDLQAEVAANGDDDDIGEVTREEAMELFMSMQEEFSGLNNNASLALSDESSTLFNVDSRIQDDVSRNYGGAEEDEYETDEYEIDYDDDTEENQSYEMAETRDENGPESASSLGQSVETNADWGDYNLLGDEQSFDLDSMDEMSDDELSKLVAEVSEPVNEAQMTELDVVQDMLPSFPKERLEQIVDVFRKHLGNPSMIDLSLCVRETMPDYITNSWLKHMSALTARYVAQKAIEDDVVNIQLLNSYLEVETSGGSIDKAIDFLSNGFSDNNMVPTSYSYRLVIQMLLKNNRFKRALQLKEQAKLSDTPIDLYSYGSLIEYCSRRNQLGSAMLLLQECIDAHGSPPNEASLKDLRLLSDRHELNESLQLTSLIGKDPIEWLRDGEANLKREKSKKGRRDVLYVQNRLLQ